jgi:pantoate--beta-alanine ligase
MNPPVLTDAGSLWEYPRTNPRAVVMTMGGLHRGHGDLFDAARQLAGTSGQSLATIFVNPLQFGPGEDLERYPRTFSSDLDICSRHEVDAVFAPAVAEMYEEKSIGSWTGITVDPGDLGAVLEGTLRPGHFRGVLTIVLKLLNLLNPDFAVFGEKDYQQLVLVRRMVQELNLPVEIVGVPTAREKDGLARSSRNVYLQPEERSLAAAIPRALSAGQDHAAAGATADEVVARTESVLVAAGITPDYVVVTTPDLAAAPDLGPARLILAAHVGGVHLLDNAAIVLGGRNMDVGR